MTPDRAAICGQLERIMASATFATATRHSRLLRYLVERTLAGEGDQLKEYVLGTEVFDRPASYDPRLDSIVRVEARRLRSRLEEYYSSDGADAPVIITIPRGSYVPEFGVRPDRGQRSALSPLAEPDRPASRHLNGRTAAILATLSTAVILLSASLVVSDRRDAAQASAKPGVAVLPFEHYTSTEADARLVAEITDAVTVELARLGTVSVASRTSAARFSGSPESVTEIARQLQVDYVMEAGVTFSGERMRVSARLVDGRRDRKVWVSDYHLHRREVADAARQIAAEAGAVLAK
jgi:TolB-like protein